VAREALPEEIERLWPRLVAVWPAYERFFVLTHERAIFVLEVPSEADLRRLRHGGPVRHEGASNTGGAHERAAQGGRTWGQAPAVTATVLVYLAWRPRMLRWGATEEEAAEALPGDEQTPHPRVQSTRAITIDAPPETVWP
jgi:hypothetical protein